MTTSLQAEIELSSDTLTAVIRDGRPDAVDMFDSLTPIQQRELAFDAWSIGIRALRNARAEAQEAQLTEIGETLKTDLGAALTTMVQQHQERVETAPRRYLDPSDGELSRRLDRLTEDDGELERVLQRFGAPDGGLIAETLSRHVG